MRTFTKKNNHKPTMNISSWRPYMNQAERNDEGSASLKYFGDHMEVAVCTYAGGQHGKPFTCLTAYFCGEMYQC